MKVFLDRPQCVLSRDQLLDLSRGQAAQAFDRNIDMQVSRPPRRLGDDPREFEITKKVRIGGYVLAANVSREP